MLAGDPTVDKAVVEVDPLRPVEKLDLSGVKTAVILRKKDQFFGGLEKRLGLAGLVVVDGLNQRKVDVFAAEKTVQEAKGGGKRLFRRRF